MEKSTNNFKSIGEYKRCTNVCKRKIWVITYLLITTTKNRYLVARRVNILTADKNSIKKLVE